MLVRAVTLYLLLLGADAAIVGRLLLHDFDQRVVQNKMLEAYTLGDDLAGRLSEELAPQGGLDQLRIVQRSRTVWRLIEDHLARLPVIDYAEILAADGRVIFRHQRDSAGLEFEGRTFGGAAPPNPDSPPALAGPRTSGRSPALFGPPSERVIQVPLAGGSGTLLLGVTSGSIQEETDRLWRQMMLKLVVGAVLSVLLLVVAFLYVLRLIHRTRRLEAEAQQATQLAQLGTLASGLAHEIRNPLNAMNINLQMLEEELGAGRVGDESVTLLRSSREEVLRLERLVKDFLAFARPPGQSRERVATSDLVADVVRFFRPEFEAAGIELALEREEGAPDVRVDASQMRQALLNVLQNALEASERGERVVVRVGASSQGEARIDVVDQGAGIPQDLEERIFDVFWSKKPAGSGLGLPIARRAVENHGGRIELKSEPGRGSTFRIVLPPAVVPAAGEARIESVASRVSKRLADTGE